MLEKIRSIKCEVAVLRTSTSVCGPVLRAAAKGEMSCAKERWYLSRFLLQRPKRAGEAGSIVALPGEVCELSVSTKIRTSRVGGR